MVARSAAPRAAPRGPAAQRRAARAADRDGDVAMGLSIKGQGRVGKSTGSAGGARKELMSRPGKGGILGATAQREILRQAGASNVTMKDARTAGLRGGLVELKITGWQKSKASESADGGVSALIKWLEKKASTRLGSRARSVKVRKSYVDKTDLIIKVAPEDVAPLVRMNNYGWAGTQVGIERVGGAVQDAGQPSSEAEKTKAMLRGVLERRYNAETKFLDLSALGQDEELKTQKIFDAKSTASKFFPAMMRVLELSFDKPEERDAAIESVSLANNDLQDLVAVSTLSQTLTKLHNLDLSNNKFEKLSALHLWRKRFYHLQHLITTGNPFEQSDPGYAAEIVTWYPNLRMLNGVQVRTDEDVANKSKLAVISFPIRSPVFQDEGGVAENFVRTFFAGFDSDRAALAAHYYDDASDFSLAVNTGAPRDPANTATTEKQEWDHYIKYSRNLKKIQQLPARMTRHYRGTTAVSNIFTSLPKTHHPDLASEARKWMVEAKMVPGIPDPSGQSPVGVDGFLIVISGEFEEVDGAHKKRSFDRTFILGPGGPTGVRVVNDMLTLRAYGGAQAFDPENFEGWNGDNNAQVASSEGVPQLPAGITVHVAEQMVTELSKQTHMTIAYAKDCLDQVAWDFPKALEAFASVRANLPPDAFMQPA